MSDSKVKVLDVGWFNNGEDDTQFNFYIEVQVDDKKVNIHSLEKYKSRSRAIRAAHKMIVLCGWEYKNE